MSPESPLVASAEAKPLLARKTSYVWKTGNPVAPIWRDNVRQVGRAAWGRSCESAKLLAGTLRCLRLCGLFSLNWSPVEQLGRCPKPHKGAPPLDPARGIPPLDPFFAARLERFSLRFGLSGFFRLYSGKGFTYPTSTPTSCSFKIIGISRVSSGVCVTRYSRTFGPILRIDSITSTI